jgi:hypothetical protein
VKNSRRVVPVVVGTSNESLISSAGGSLLLATARATGLDRALSAALVPWRAPRAVHDPGKVVLDLAVAVALGGDCLADVAVVRAQPGLFGAVASDPTVSRLVAALAADPAAALGAIRSARATARAAAWVAQRPITGGQVVVDLDATLVSAHSEKELAAPTFKRGFGFHPLLAFADHGPGGTGEPLAGVLRGGKATANDAKDHIAVLDAALAQLPEADRGDVLVRADSGGGTKAFLGHITGLGLQYSVGFYASTFVIDALASLPRQAWRHATEPDGSRRDGAQVAELTRWLPDMTTHGWPPGMRVIARRERPHPGAQLRITDTDGWRITIFATNTPGGRLAGLEARHRLRARAEDRIRALKDSGLRNLPLHDFAANQVWCELVLLAADLTAWTQTLALTGTPARVWEPKRLRLRLLHVAARIITSGRRRRLRLPRDWPWADLITDGHRRLHALA